MTIRAGLHIAASPHRCSMCGRAIHQGEAYWRKFGAFEDDPRFEVFECRSCHLDISAFGTSLSIVGECDAPEPSMLVWLHANAGNGKCIVEYICGGKSPKWQRPFRVRELTPVNKFGVEIALVGPWLVSQVKAPSVATYRDGEPRQWQGRGERSRARVRDKFLKVFPQGVLVPCERVGDFCRKCGGVMKPGKALQNTPVAHEDFPGGGFGHGCTITLEGPAELVDCLKCESCGWSVAAGTTQAGREG